MFVVVVTLLLIIKFKSIREERAAALQSRKWKNARPNLGDAAPKPRSRRRPAGLVPEASPAEGDNPFENPIPGNARGRFRNGFLGPLRP